MADRPNFPKYRVRWLQTEDLETALNGEWTDQEYRYRIVSVIALHRNPGEEQQYRVVWERDDG